MAFEIHKLKVRVALAPRREPYWAVPLGVGQSLGYRKITDATGYWIAKRKERGRARYKALGPATETFQFHEAREAARKWFTDLDCGVTGDRVTVSEACREYVKDRREEKGKACAQDAEKRFERTVYGRPLGYKPLDKLRTSDIRTWRNGLAMEKSSANRTFTSLKAALNLAVTNRLVSASAAIEWKSVKPFKHAGRRRDLFLDLAQRRALLAACKGAVRDLVEAAMLTGRRAGELVNATRGQFDARTESMTFAGKTGTHKVPLSAAAVALFKRLTESKLPLARLLVRDDGKPWQHSDWDQLVRDAAKEAKLPAGVCLYTLRHSFISQAIQDGLSILDVARLVGTSIAMIEKHYGHLAQGVTRERLAMVHMT